ncbi:hypothetical protein Hypma_013621 [Hypsizygus marmoreus]|uniref:N-acetyltransferase domain-containing protein n=1 Tax=Hypsizygus marmoreus TaxID=39966 RepID=A0A369JBH8_HYPMA|nr:hypothetical protein Hypma_013621 [Hypsizygus marmoreus]
MGQTSFNAPTENRAQSNIMIRAYRHPDDAGPIRRMFLEATMGGPGSPYSEAMASFSPYTTATNTSLSAGLALLAFSRTESARDVAHSMGIEPSSIIGVAGLLLLVSVVVFLYGRWQRRRIDVMFKTYMKESLAGLEDIVGTFKLRVKNDGSCAPTARSECWVAIDSETGKVAGFVGLDCDYHSDPEIGEVRRLMVSPDCQRCGVGDKLMDMLDDHAREHGVKALELMTSDFNTSAIRFYKKRGWRPKKKRQYAGTSVRTLRREV